MTIHAKLIVLMATMFVLLLAVSVSIGTWTINTIIYKLNTDLLSLKLEAKIGTIEAAIELLEISGAIGIDKYVRQAQTEMLQHFQESLSAEDEQYYILTGKERRPLLQVRRGQDMNIRADVFTRMLDTHSGTTNIRDKGRTYFTVYRYVEAWDWLVGISLSKATMFQQRQVYLMTVGSFSALVFVGVFLLAYGIGKRLIVNPIAMLVDMTKAIAAGHFDQTLQLSQRDEMGQLADAIRTMAQQLHQNFTQIDAQFATIQRDMAERARAEEKIRQLNEELEQRVADRTAQLEAAQIELLRQERLATLGKLTATVSHEIRNPLATIRTSTFAITRKTRDKGLGVEHALERIERNITRCDDIIGELLDYTRMSEPTLQAFVFDDWLHRFLDEQTFPEEIQFVRDLSAAIPVSFDPARFQRVMINLLDNACQAMLEDTQRCAEQSTLLVHMHTTVVNGQVQLSISDTGPGIPADVLPHIFEPLYSTKSFGVGLGLPIVKEIIQQHDGDIEVISEAGQGTRVTLWLPVLREEKET